MKTAAISFLLMIGIPFFLVLLIYGCTLNIVQTDTHGHASDVSDVTSTDSADLAPNLDLP